MMPSGDELSLKAVSFALRRMRAGRVLGAVAVRPEGLAWLPPGLTRLAADQGALVELGDLDTAEVAELTELTELAGAGRLPRRAVVRLREHTAAGGTSVTISGVNFTGATAVTFGTAAATGVVVNSATSITATSPPGTGTADITVTTPAGTSPANPFDSFKYIPGPKMTTSSLPQGSVGTSYSATLTAKGGRPRTCGRSAPVPCLQDSLSTPRPA